MSDNFIKSMGCGLTAIFLLALATAFCSRWQDASYDQPAEECVRMMSRRIIEKTAALPDDAVLKAKSARIEHDLFGSESQADATATALEKQGWLVTVNPQDEIHWAAEIIEDPIRFRRFPVRRVRQLCALAATNSMKYQTWRINALGIADYVSQ